MSSFWWITVAVFIAVFAKGKCESTAYPTIPNQLLECYRNDDIYHRANRFPNSFESFLDLIKKVEGGPTSRNLNARELALALVHYVKQDGIQSVRHKNLPDIILGSAPSGPEYFKHRLTLVGLIPSIDRSYLTLFNETLTQKEMCNLHFMLSYSIDPYKRENERCSPLFEESRKGTDAEAWSGWRYGGRHRRRVSPGGTWNELNGEKVVRGKASEVLEVDEAKGNLEKSYKRQVGSNLPLRRKRNSENERDKKSEVEKIPAEQNSGSSKQAEASEKDKFTIGEQQLLSDGERHSQSWRQALVQKGAFGKFGGRAPASASEEGFYSGVIPGIPLSECPVVNGVVATPYGPLVIGAVVAGIAAGLNFEEISPTKLSVSPSELDSLSDKVVNVWAATLAGTVADTISSSALLDPNRVQILRGGWNDSSDPKWYLLPNNQFNQMVEVAIRGSLDGLLLGLNAKDWVRSFSGFKLSQMLITYYDCLWGSTGAKNRVQLMSKYSPDEIFRKQVYLMSLVLKKQKTNFLTVLDYRVLAKEVVGKVIQHIQTMDDNEKSHIGTFLSTKIDNSINTVAVIDSSWGHENLYKIFQTLRSAEVASSTGNNLTILCGQNGKVLMSSDNSADLHDRFTKVMLTENCSRGLDLPLIFDTLDIIYRKIYHDEKVSEKMNTNAQVVVLFPFDSPLRENAEYITEKSKTFRSNFPDVRLLVVSAGRSENLLPLVNGSKDLFPLSMPLTSDSGTRSVREFAEGMKQSYQRICRPSCGSYFNDDSPGKKTSEVKDVRSGAVVYYRLLPQYFYTQHEQATVTITSKLRAPLTVCHSREMERPAGPSPRGVPGPEYDSDWNRDRDQDFPSNANLFGRQTEAEGPVQCKTITSEQYKIELNDPCQGASNLRECRPLYISLSPPLQETVSFICPTCRLPTNVEYEITVEGLTCYNAAAATLASPLLLSLIFIRYCF